LTRRRVDADGRCVITIRAIVIDQAAVSRDTADTRVAIFTDAIRVFVTTLAIGLVRKADVITMFVGFTVAIGVACFATREWAFFIKQAIAVVIYAIANLGLRGGGVARAESLLGAASRPTTHSYIIFETT